MKPSKSYNSRYQIERIKEYLKKGAKIVDVRSIQEWKEGHTTHSTHIEYSTIPNHIDTIKEFGKPIIAVCRSGHRSGEVTKFLQTHGVDIINGGSWQNVAELVQFNINQSNTHTQ